MKITKTADHSKYSLLIAMLASAFAGHPAGAQFAGLADCLRGDGSYAGELTGTCGYKVDNDDPRGTLLRLCFSGALWDLYAGADAPLATATSPAVFVEALVSNNGFFSSSATTYPLTGYTFSAQGSVRLDGGCGIEGTWEIRSAGGDVLAGTYQLAGSTGPNCFDPPGGSTPTTGAPGMVSACSPLGVAAPALAIAGIVGLRRKRLRSR